MKSLRDDSNLELNLHLPRLNCGPQGFTEIAATLMTNRIQHLEGMAKVRTIHNNQSHFTK